MKEIISIKDIDDCDFIIKWRMTDMCNAHCSYCLRNDIMGAISKPTKEAIEQTNRRMSEVAYRINTLLSGQNFNNVKIDLIGGEVTMLDLQSICSNFNCGKIKKINITTNILRDIDYYINLAKLLHSKNIKLTITASFHFEFQSFEKYFDKIIKLRPYTDILACEMVSLKTNQDLVKRFINKCKELKIDYQAEADLRSSNLDDRRNGLIVDISRKQKLPRYLVTYSNGEQKYYTGRNQLLTDPNNDLNINQNLIRTQGMYCTQGYNFFYIDYDKVASRTKDINNCTLRIPIEEFEILKPQRCCAKGCSLCGHVSLYKNYEDFQKDFES